MTQSIFVDLFKKGDIVEDLRPNIYDPVEGTTIADAEVERLPRTTKLVDVKWTCADGTELVISTTRPEMICACGVVVVHPDDDRYAPGGPRHPPSSTGRRPFHDCQNSTTSQRQIRFRYGCSHGVFLRRSKRCRRVSWLALAPFQAIDLDGMTEVAGPLSGMKVIDARKAAIERLDSDGRLAQAVERGTGHSGV